MLLLEEECRFKIGDLVVISEPVEFMIYDMIVKPGDVGLVIGVEYDTEILSVWGIDYIVDINEIIIHFGKKNSKSYDSNKLYEERILNK